MVEVKGGMQLKNGNETLGYFQEMDIEGAEGSCLESGCFMKNLLLLEAV